MIRQDPVRGVLWGAKSIRRTSGYKLGKVSDLKNVIFEKTSKRHKTRQL